MPMDLAALPSWRSSSSRRLQGRRHESAAFNTRAHDDFALATPCLSTPTNHDRAHYSDAAHSEAVLALVPTSRSRSSSTVHGRLGGVGRHEQGPPETRGAGEASRGAAVDGPHGADDGALEDLGHLGHLRELGALDPGVRHLHERGAEALHVPAEAKQGTQGRVDVDADAEQARHTDGRQKAIRRTRGAGAGDASAARCMQRVRTALPSEPGYSTNTKPK